jgi:hypothetical protein
LEIAASARFASARNRVGEVHRHPRGIRQDSGGECQWIWLIRVSRGSIAFRFATNPSPSMGEGEGEGENRGFSPSPCPSHQGQGDHSRQPFPTSTRTEARRTKDIRPIRTNDDLRDAMHRLEAVFQAGEGTPEADRDGNSGDADRSLRKLALPDRPGGPCRGDQVPHGTSCHAK